MTQATDSQGPVIVLPHVGSCYGNGWRQLWKHFAELLLTGIVWLVVTVPVGIIFGLIFALGWQAASWGIDFIGVANINTDMNWGAQAVNAVLNILYFTPLSYGFLYVFLEAARNRKVQIGDLFAGFKRNYTNIILVALIFFAIFSLPSLLIQLLFASHPVIGGLVSLVWAIIAVILYCKLAFVSFLLVDQQMQATEAIRTSWNWTNGHAGTIFLIILLGIPIMIAGLIVFIIGVIPALMWIIASIASMYHAVKLNREYSQMPPGGPFIIQE